MILEKNDSDSAGGGTIGGWEGGICPAVAAAAGSLCDTPSFVDETGVAVGPGMAPVTGLPTNMIDSVLRSRLAEFSKSPSPSEAGCSRGAETRLPPSFRKFRHHDIPYL